MSFDAPNVHRQFLFAGDDELKTFFIYLLIFFNDLILIIIRLLYATLICQQMEYLRGSSIFISVVFP